MSESRRRILLDENVDRGLQTRLERAFEVSTVRHQGWQGTSNGELLEAAAAEFDVFVTMDRHLPYQQNLLVYELAVVVIRARSNALSDVEPLLDELVAAIQTSPAGQARFVGYGAESH